MNNFSQCLICNRENYFALASTSKIIHCKYCGAPVYDQSRPPSMGDFQIFQKSLAKWASENRALSKAAVHGQVSVAKQKKIEELATFIQRNEEEFKRLESELRHRLSEADGQREMEAAGRIGLKEQLVDLQRAMKTQKEDYETHQTRDKALIERLRTLLAESTDEVTAVKQQLAKAKASITDMRMHLDTVNVPLKSQALTILEQSNTQVVIGSSDQDSETFTRVATVALSRESQEDLWSGRTVNPTFSLSSRGNYYVVTSDSHQFYLIVKNDALLDISNVTLLQTIYDFVYEPNIISLERQYKKLAKVGKSKDKCWVLTERGELLFYG